MSHIIPPSQLIINPDGSIFHLHLRPEQIADTILLVGDPGRVPLVASHFSDIECEVASREFHTITGHYHHHRVTVLSTGIGCDNIDIVLNELDALANVDFATRTVNPQFKQLTIVRIGTCGGLQPQTPLGTYVASQYSIGFDGLLNFYGRRNIVCHLDIEAAFLRHMGWTGSQCIAHPYVVHADPSLLDQVAQTDMVRGITIACGGFYGPQGRSVRLPLADPEANCKIEDFVWNGMKITNFEMESSAVSGLSLLMGHKALTCCMVVANRLCEEANPNYKQGIDGLIHVVLSRLFQGDMG